MDNVNLTTGEYVICQKELMGSLIPETRYLLIGQSAPNNAILFVVATDSLTVKNYHYDSANISNRIALRAFTIVADGQKSLLLYSGDYFDLNITSYKSGRISGTFTATFTNYTNLPNGGAGSTLITEGKINNVQVIY